MTPDDFKERFKSLKLTITALIVVFMMILGFAGLLIYDPQFFEENISKNTETITQGTDESGFIEGNYKMLVVANCTACHSSKLVTQNRASKEGWKNMIRWMQETQNLWDLGENEEKILEYLSKHYAPEGQGRRASLKVEAWYALDN
ncbi:cytochrome C [Roseivirga sp.]|uniref:cytochrome C n=1 Tax=Roseivirga sp. TaxID=1964215 RepID=UPI003B8CB4C0